RSSIRAWSAGCATGEEAYSIAACLLDLLPWPRSVSPEVVGTDLLERNLAAARVGEYGAWSQRPSGPVLHPIFKDAGSGRVRIDDARPAAKPAPPAAAPPAGPPPPYLPRVRPPEPVALHLRALVHIERGEKKRAEKELAELARQVPDYVPGILERALLHVRMG